ncbi:MAG: M15 family metallopeptidase [Umezawaea sp.]
MSELVLLSDPLVADLPARECGEPLVDLRTIDELVHDYRQADPKGAYVHLRAGVVERLLVAQGHLPAGVRLLIIEAYRPLWLQERYFEEYAGALRDDNPEWSDAEIRVQASRYISPPEIAPHVSGAAVDLTLCHEDGRELDMGTEVNASPEESDNACYTGAPGISASARHNRELLSSALEAAGLVNYPTEWWHWSYGDRYWAMLTGAPAAVYGPKDLRL